ncbi:MAG: UDP-N-acetylmuramoyl-L-alanyl-D-glutamate--2,6-diaminopimelate ligase [Acidimicrobiia bacterium]
MQLHDLLADLAGFDGAGVLELRDGPGPNDPQSPVEVTSVVHNSRDVRPGALFCCIKGSVTDGHVHAPAAVSGGAVALLVERWVPVDVPQARVSSVRALLGPLAARFHGEPAFAMRVLGATGTNGKTTTTYLLESIARAAGDVAGVIGTVAARVGDRVLSNSHTTPEATELQSVLAEMRDEGVETVAMEVSSHALDQHRVDGTNFAATCFTNLSHDHLDYHESVDAYFEAKARLFTPVFTRRAAINVGDVYGEQLARRAATKGLVVSRFALDDPSAHVTARRVELSPQGTRFDLVACSENPVPVRMSLVGSFNVVNALGAAATALLAGFELDAIVAGLEQPTIVPGRMERIETGQDFTVLVDYAHTPAALDAALGAARELVGPGGRLIAVFGCGGDRDRTKRPLMGDIAARSADCVYVTTDNPRSEEPAAIVDEIMAGVPSGSRVARVLDRRAAIRDALTAARPGDVVVVAGKGHEREQIVGGRTEMFDDRAVAREELETLA